jgi:type IV secretion system protein TrbF
MLKNFLSPRAIFRNPNARGRAGVEQPARTESTRAAAGKPMPPNPYLEARRDWNERYGDYIHQAHSWRIRATVSGAVALVCVIGIAYVGARSKIVPYVLEVDKLGKATAVARADRPPDVDVRVIKASLVRFVADWRTVTVDHEAQKGAIDRVYAMLPGGSLAAGKLNEYYRAHNPLLLASKVTVAVAVTNLVRISERTWQAEWQEVTRDDKGAVQSTVRMKVSILVGIAPPTQESQILINPLGVYITDLNWSQQL